MCSPEWEDVTAYLVFIFCLYSSVDDKNCYSLDENTPIGDNGGLEGKAMKADRLVMIYWKDFNILLLSKQSQWKKCSVCFL